MDATNVLEEIEELNKKVISDAERAVQILEEALSGYSGKSKNSLIKEAIKLLK